MTITDASALLGATLKSLTQAASKYGEALTQGNSDLGDPTIVKSAHFHQALMNRQAHAMDQYAGSLSADIPVFSSAAAANLEGMEKLWALHLAGEAGDEDDFLQAFRAFQGLTSNLKSFRPTMESFKNHLAQTPRLTKEFSVAKRSLMYQIDSFTAAATLFVARSTLFIETVYRSLDKD